MISKVHTKSISNLIRNIIYFIPFALVYILSRFQNLTTLPVFADEAIYIRWSQIIKSVETLRFIPLTDGKQPLFMWLTVPLLKIFSDPLFAGRTVSVFAGLGTLFFLYLIAKFFNFSKPSIFILLIIYLVSPFTFFFDRMALADNLLTFFGVLTLYLSLLQGRYLRLDISLILGTVLGLAWLTKSPAMFFIVLSFLTVFIYQKNYIAILYSSISSVIAFIIYNLLRLGPQFHMIALRNQDYIWNISEIIKHPLDPLIPHLKDIFNLFSAYLPFIFFSLFLLLLLNLVVNKTLIRLNKEFTIILLWWLPSLLFTVIFSKVFTARYMLFTVPILFLFITSIINNIKCSSYIKYICLSLFVISSLSFLFRLSFQPFDVKFTSTETGYNQNWTAGWGIKESSVYLTSRSKVANVIVGTEGYFGTLPDGLQIYTNNIPNLTVFGIGLNLESIPYKLIDAKNHGDEVYLLINSDRLFIDKDTLNIVNRFPKPDGSQLLLIRI